jgi:DNA-directed RNA polymerase specialized sigma54-like protein
MVYCANGTTYSVVSCGEELQVDWSILQYRATQLTHWLTNCMEQNPFLEADRY